MRVHDHIALSTAAAALLYPVAGKRVLGAWAASILIDGDHYIWYAVKHRNPNPVDAYRFFNEANPPQHAATHFLHTPAALALAVMAGMAKRQLMPVAIGVVAHLAMDDFHRTRVARARLATLRRDEFTCQWCGAQSPDVVAHLDRQPAVLPSYRLENFITLCPSCHEAAHADARPAPRRALRVVSALLAGIWKVARP